MKLARMLLAVLLVLRALSPVAVFWLPVVLLRRA